MMVDFDKWGLKCINKIESCKDNSNCLDIIPYGVRECSDEFTDRFRCLFYRVLTVFSRDSVCSGYVGSIPAKLGDGRSVDFLNLYRVVRRRGGYELVSKKGLWGCVVKELGLDSIVRASLKLMYFKYLYSFEKWFKGTSGDMYMQTEIWRHDQNFGLLMLELEKGLKVGLLKGLDDMHLKSKRDGNCNGVDNRIRRLDFRHGEDVQMVERAVNKSRYDDEKACGVDKKVGEDGDRDLSVSDSRFSEKVLKSRKRKRDPLECMLKWLIETAKSTDDPGIGVKPELSKLKEHEQEYWAQAIRARDVLLESRWNIGKIEGSHSEKKLKMHPSMFEDNSACINESMERLRRSERLPALIKSRCNNISSTKSNLGSPRKHLENCSKKQALLKESTSPAKSPGQDDLLASDKSQSLLDDEQYEDLVPLGPRFQADVPKWTGHVSQSDSKWLGTPTWPWETSSYCIQEIGSIGKGRPSHCDCILPGSVECIRFHCAENRIKLKLELGETFYLWRFHRMGEEVSLQWKYEEERKFMDIVRSNPPSQDMCFWDDAFKYFCKKSRGDLVSYYFNVHLVRRRSYQNRVTPQTVDSDDDESEFGSVSDIFGYKAVTIPGFDSVLCSLNKQCDVLE